MKPESVSMLRCPRTGEPLRLVSEPGPDASPRQVLVSDPSGHRYAVREGIPVLLDPDAVSGLNEQYQGLYTKAARFYDPAMRVAAALAGGREPLPGQLVPRLGHLAGAGLAGGAPRGEAVGPRAPRGALRAVD